MDPWGLLEDPRGGNKDKKDAKIGSVRRRRNNLALERGHIKHAERYQAPWGMDNLRKESRKKSSCIDL